MAQGYDKDRIVLLNQCRIFLKVNTLSDISNGSGSHISSCFANGNPDPHRNTNIIYLIIKKPTPTHWNIWEKCIKDTFTSSCNSLRLRTQLGTWTQLPRQTWEWYYDPQLDRLYRWNGKFLHLLSRDISMYTSSRSNSTWYRTTRVITDVTFPIHIFALATINGSNSAYTQVSMDGWAYVHRRSSIPKQAPTSHNLLQQLQYDGAPSWITQHQEPYLRSITKSYIESFLLQKTSRVVFDGSYKEDKGAAAIILENINLHHSIIITSLVPANIGTHENDAYRSEAVGVLAGLILLKSMQNLSPIPHTFTISCDNDEVLRKAEHTTLVHSKFKHQDIIKSLIYTRNSISFQLLYEEVLGHAKRKVTRKLTRLEELNDYCDILANQARVSLPVIHPSLNTAPGEGPTLWHKHRKLYSDVSPTLHHQYFRRKAKPIIMEKHSISQTEFEAIDWTATAKAASLLSPSSCIYISKHITGFLPIGKNMVRRGQWREPSCPRCQFPLETTAHLFQCPHSSSKKIFQASLQRLEAWLVSVFTDATLTDQILEIITLWRGNAQINTNPNYLSPINNQIQLGWKHFMHGRLHSSFREFMHSHYSSINSKRQSSTWAAILVQKIWTILHKPQWESRNKFVHNLDRITETSRERLNLQSELKTTYNSEIKENLLQCDQFLYDESLSTLRKLPNASIRAWLKSFDTAKKARDMT